MKNKEVTKRKLLNAVGHIIENDGFAALGVNKVAKAAGVSKALIYRYFGNFFTLVQSCVEEKDFWAKYLAFYERAENYHLPVAKKMEKLLNELFNSIYNDCRLEAAKVNEISNNHGLQEDAPNTSVFYSRRILPVRGKNDGDRAIYFNIISLLLAAGTNHLILQNSGDKDMDSNKSDDKPKAELLNSMEQILDWTFG